MDLSALNTKTGANKGAFLHLKHPALGHKLYTGEGADEHGQLVDKATATAVGCYVLGLESEAARSRARAIAAARMKDKSDEDGDEERGLDFVCSLVTGFEGIEHDGKPLTASHEDKRAFFGQSDALIGQVMEFAQEKSNFFARTSNG